MSSGSAFFTNVAPAADWRLVRRVGMLVALLTVELLFLRQWLDAAEGLDSGALATFLAHRGPGTVRFVVVRFLMAFGLVSLVFVDAKAIEAPRRVLASLSRQRFDWPRLVAHFVLVAFFAALCSFLYDIRLPAPLDITLTTVWLFTGLTAIALAIVAFVPALFWDQVFRNTRHVLAFAFLVSVGGYVSSQMALSLWQPLSRGTLTVAYALLHPVVPGLTANPATFMLGSPNFQVEIGPPCSGYEGLGLMLVFTVAWLWFHRTEWRFPQALMLIPGGLAAIWVINCVRVAALVLIGTSGSPGIAINGFHTQAGWLGFTAVALGICLTARRVPWLLKDAADASASRATVTNPVAPYVIPFLAILASAMVAQLASNGFEWLYPIRVIAALVAFWYFWPTYRTRPWRCGWMSILFGVSVFVIWVAAEPFVSTTAHAGMPLALSQAPVAVRFAWIAFRVLGAAVTVPIAEELAFRGFLLRQFDGHDFESVKWQAVSWTAILLSSVAFAVLHGERWLPAIMAGVAYALAVKRRGSIGDAIAAHAITNLLIAGAVLFGGFWQLW